MTLDERIARLEALLTSPVPGTQITRVMRPDQGFQWCVAVGVLQAPKLFFYGDTIEAAVSAAEVGLLTPVVPDEATRKMLAKNPSRPLYQGAYVRAVFNLDGIDLSAYATPARTRATS